MAKRTVEESSLTAVADAIRGRAGTSEPLVFPDGFVGAVEGIQDTNLNDVLQKKWTHVYSELEQVSSYALYGFSNLVSVDMPNLKLAKGYMFAYCTSLKDVNIPSAEIINFWAFDECRVLEKLDFLSVTRIDQYALFGCNALKVLVLRQNQVVSLENINAFSHTPFASDGTAGKNPGGTVYVPAAQIQNYQTATNWSTLYAAGTCNFVAIEGSEYE